MFGAYTCIAENLHGRLEKVYLKAFSLGWGGGSCLRPNLKTIILFTQVVLLSEGAKPGTPQIQPNKIFGDSIRLIIQVMRVQQNTLPDIVILKSFE